MRRLKTRVVADEDESHTIASIFAKVLVEKLPEFKIKQILRKAQSSRQCTSPVKSTRRR